jgi:8-oxo-dGTP pyrophosphatase MutT (NUDIX family)
MDEILATTKWLQIRKTMNPEFGIHGYQYAHKVISDGHDVAILPYRWTDNGTIEVLLRKELTPAWKPLGYKVNAITGGIDKGMTPKQAAIQEVKQEAGYTITEDDLIDLGTIFISKAEDTIYHLFSVDLTDFEQGDVEPDGGLEEQESCFWESNNLDYRIDDALVYVLAGRMKWGNHNA